MDCTKEEFNEAILNLANHHNIEGKYNSMINYNELVLTEIVKRLGYDLFIHGFSYHDATHNVRENYHKILQYDEELQKNGFVKFKE